MMAPTRTRESEESVPPIHPTNAWNPTGHTLLPVPGTRLYYAHLERLSGLRTQVFLGGQRHLTFVADFPETVPVDALREKVILEQRLYPHLVDRVPPKGGPDVSARRGWEP